MDKQRDSLIGREIDGYEIEELLGHGGMARVYRALDTKLQRYAAVKVIDPQARNPKKYEERFDREARAIAQLSHPNIVIVYRFNDVESLYYMAMEYIDGADLSWIFKDYQRDDALMDYKTLVDLVGQVGAALDYAHANGVIHRDIKPGNIMIDRQGNVKLTDFGLALMASEGTGGDIFGSPHYIAPEQAMNSSAAVPQSDLYSLGVIIYEALAGDIPYSEGSAMQIAMAHMSAPLPDPLLLNPDLDPAFVPFLEKALAKEPEDRYQSGALLAKALRDAVSSAKSISARQDTETLPMDRIAMRRQSIKTEMPADDTKGLTEMADSEPATPDKKKHVSEAKSNWGMRLALVLLVVMLVGSAYVFLQPSAPTTPPINASIEGTVEQIDGAQFTIYGLPITVQDDASWLQELQVGDRVRLRGHTDQTDDGIRLNYVASVQVNGESLLETPEATAESR